MEGGKELMCSSSLEVEGQMGEGVEMENGREASESVDGEDSRREGNSAQTEGEGERLKEGLKRSVLVVSEIQVG